MKDSSLEDEILYDTDDMEGRLVSCGGLTGAFRDILQRNYSKSAE